MGLLITGRHIDIDTATRKRIEAKAEKLGRYFDRIHEVEVVIAQEKFKQVAEVVLRCDGFRVKAQEANADVLTALDRVFEKIESQIKKYKRRLIDTRRRPPRKSIAATDRVLALAPAVEVQDEAEDMEARLPTGTLIEPEERELLAMTPEDAAMHLDLSGEPFFVFLNIENHHINIAHNRPDGRIGVIEPVVD